MSLDMIEMKAKRHLRVATVDTIGAVAEPRQVTVTEKTTRMAIGRSTTVDGIKGLAVIFMVVFHFCFDLTVFGIYRTNFNVNPFWLNFRVLIVTMFLTMIGVNLVQAKGSKKPHAFLKRQLKLLACSLLVSVGSYLIFPQSFIYFGVLHFAFAAGLIGSLFTDFVWINLGLGIAVLTFSAAYSSTFFNPKYLSWIGLVTRKPITEDFVPLFPWMGLVFIGMFLAHVISRKAPVLLQIPAPKFVRWLGANSLKVYLLHQPILFGLLFIYMRF